MSSHKAKTYNASLMSPRETTIYFLPSGTSISYDIYLSDDGKKLVKCDICGQYLPLTAKGLLTQLKKHRGTQACNAILAAAAQQDQRAPTNQALVFVNTFQDSQSETHANLIATCK
jgi:hypothetical protein